ncbi:LOW QUALITY PROTEIN: uncharacterized protein MICPUCDRAFT_69293 [Micromonas pusilla CCMP1545]|uniref:Predicted protein n=1 Tax=Micromonas pusilla (strain CCMP1545) TaxID=564608 RepID=C1MY49_MICPC|nr:LOW QUALITY PROTEIN: uncharacterized protein MICPUCDRAFT_69293 [Micromonas pusilla CCMP1545]EEH55578.1 predicted protein [Micromonas pusilla CCMP1545]|eukprot:XP_003060809.1 predicted protein [Micromonas pusilla CCMP1545]
MVRRARSRWNASPAGGLWIRPSLLWWSSRPRPGPGPGPARRRSRCPRTRRRDGDDGHAAFQWCELRGFDPSATIEDWNDGSTTAAGSRREASDPSGEGGGSSSKRTRGSSTSPR